MSYFVGIDWASREHTVCVIDAQARVVWRATVPHTADGLTALRTKLARFAASGTLRVAIERPSGLVVDTLVEAGFAVVPIHPNVLKASRPRYATAGGKSDVGDAFILADLLRTDGHRFRSLQPLSDDTRALRALVRTRDDLVRQRLMVANQLRALLESFWPGAAALFGRVDAVIALAFLRQYPTPRHAQHLGEKRLQVFLTRQGYSGSRSAEELLARLRSAPVRQVGDAELAAQEEVVQALVAVLDPLVAQIQRLTATIEQAIAAHADGPVFTSFPRVGRLNAAQVFAEIGDDRGRFTSAEHLAADAGVVPVTYQSGKHRGVAFRWACNKRLRGALTTFADNSRHASPWAAAVYTRARGRGCDHSHATRILARAWLRVLWRCWQDRRPYDPAIHGALIRMATPA